MLAMLQLSMTGSLAESGLLSDRNVSIISAYAPTAVTYNLERVFTAKLHDCRRTAADAA